MSARAFSLAAAVICCALAACSSAPDIHPRGALPSSLPVESPSKFALAPSGVRAPDARAFDPPHVGFEWPLENPTVINFYGWRRRRMHEGIDLRARKGTPIFAAAPGQVIYAGRRLRGYGKLVVLDHGQHWSSVYAHCSKIEVKVGEWVAGGDEIALSGRTGRASGPHLHFEIRKGSDPLDPLLLLPAGMRQARAEPDEDVDE